MAMKKNIKYWPNVRWLSPFIESVAHLVPIERLSYIKGYKIRRNFEPAQEAQIIKTLPNGKCVITIKVIKYDKRLKKHVNAYIANVLESLAHELAHLTHWEHTSNHFRLQAEIMMKFCNVMDEIGMTDTGVRIDERTERLGDETSGTEE